MSQIEVKNVYKIFGKNPKKVIPLLEKEMTKDQIHNKTGYSVGVNNVSFQVNKGEFFVVMGLSGSGKSTLIRCLNRLICATSGEILIDGEDILKCKDDKLLEIRRKKIAMVFQNFALFPHRTICSNVEYGLEIQGIASNVRKKKAYKALKLVGLKGYEESMPDELSGGMKQRVGLARALATDPEILLMDEAFSALDPLIRKEMQEEMLQLQSKMHKTVIFITHDLDEALRLGDRIAIMKDGLVEQIGTSEDILTDPASDYIKNFVQDVDRTKIITASIIMEKSKAITLSKDGPKSAVRLMKDEGISSIYVTDKNRKLKGIIKIEDAIELGNHGIPNVESILITEIPTTSPETPISDLLSVAKDAIYPIAVVDEEHTMLGIIKRSTIIAGIAGEEN
ncbi:quaternary amine ABC transporter ATP-binding protein [Clostridium tyrobutyricum]|uniref:quaternary amine ABC transporter ATP-binding protein n=1 Tax=Clostridium tyrobutyricum TaxID=1519 RepID=UPI001C394110|nr:glycine betaine/L-proline ABC transporter ATP-binding protein [Clostridium tyrobutyricum]MBV4427494.1 glycine betaine/L-proline ABC transporter ATP-binding protein [Clostridium tyrobutyricum]MBV4443796.1 glycine betaine/L-proline ABC transporter ATP-binding protein [Clostridium tyrobutyricum]